MRIAVALGGTDNGQSGIGVYVRSVLPALRLVAERNGDVVFVVGTAKEAAAVHARRSHLDVVLPSHWDAPAASAAFYLGGGASRAAARAGADVLLLPAANRRAEVVGSCPTVGVVHDLAQLHVSDKYDVLRMAYFRHVLKMALPTATELVAISAATRKDLAPFLGRAEDSIRIVANGIDFEKFSPLPEDGERARAQRQKHGLEGPYMLYVSRLEHPGKNHLRLLDAYASSSLRGEVTLVLAGKDWGARAAIIEKAEALGIASHVRLLGFVDDESLLGLYAGASAALMLGLAEGFGLPALEALSMGITVVASSTGGLPEVVGDLGILCDPFDVTDIGKALVRAQTDAGGRARIRVEGPRHAASRGWESTAAGLYEACLAARGTHIERWAA